MPFSPVALWKQDTAFSTYIFGFFLIGFPLMLYPIYVTYHLQIVGYSIGTDGHGHPCAEYCLVPFGSHQLDLNSVLLYLNAMGMGIGGVSALLISAYADFWKNKSTLLTLMIICYGLISIPVYWLRDISHANFKALMALYVVWAVITGNMFIIFNMFIPHFMRTAEQKEPSNLSGSEQNFGNKIKVETTKPDTLTNGIKASTPRTYGFKVSISGAIGLSLGGTLAIVSIIVLSKALPGADSQTAGLLVTTIAGFVTIAGSIVTYRGLPVVPAKPKKDWKAWWIGLFVPLKDLLGRKNIAILLLGYTIYNDTVFTMYSITGQLFFHEVKPDLLEYSLFAISYTLIGAILTFGFYLWQSWRPPFSLEYWLLIGFSLILIVPIWGSIGLINNINFGLKNRWEFYIQNVLFNLSTSIVHSVFRVVFSEMVPKGSELEWFGLQMVFSSATAWIGYVVNAPLQNATHQLRFPLVLCSVILIVPVALEIMRGTMKVFVNDKIRWKEHDEFEAHGSDSES